MKYLRLSSLIFLLVLISACSHKFDSNVLDLSFYQWNLWADLDAEISEEDPSCGWEDLHRGKGKLVRIPALAEDHFPAGEVGNVYWYHCRFTLPENWEDREVTLLFEGLGPVAEVFLNQGMVGSYKGVKGELEMDVSEVIFYTRDNHLAIRVSIPDASLSGEAGLAGSVLAQSKIAP